MTPDKAEAALGVLREVAKSIGIQLPRSLAELRKASTDQALSVLTEALAEMGWRPIESAPRDGSCVLLADADCVTPGFYHDGSECYGHRGGAGFFDESDRGSLLTASNFHATHWKPLPEPPNE